MGAKNISIVEPKSLNGMIEGEVIMSSEQIGDIVKKWADTIKNNHDPSLGAPFIIGIANSGIPLQELVTQELLNRDYTSNTFQYNPMVDFDSSMALARPIKKTTSPSPGSNNALHNKVVYLFDDCFVTGVTAVRALSTVALAYGRPRHINLNVLASVERDKTVGGLPLSMYPINPGAAAQYTVGSINFVPGLEVRGGQARLVMKARPY